MAALTSAKEAPMIKGTMVSQIYQWLHETYGPELLIEALLLLPPDERDIFSKKILSVGSYSLSTWAKYLDACYVKVKRKTGESEAVFYRNLIHGGGSKVLKAVYTFLMVFINPLTIVKRLPLIYGRTYDSGGAEVLLNELGRTKIRYYGPKDMHRHMQQFGLLTLCYLLELSGAKSISGKIANERTDLVEFSFEAVVSYRM
jgi:hypothetical protein